MTINREFLNANHADLVAAIRLEGFQAGLAEGQTAGMTAERTRIQAVEAQTLPGHEKLIAQLKFDGKTTGPEAAVQVLAAEKTVAAGRAGALAADGSQINVPATNTPLAAPAAGPTEDDENVPLEERCKAKWDKTPALRTEFNNKFSTYLAYERNAKKGVARILKSA